MLISTEGKRAVKMTDKNQKRLNRLSIIFQNILRESQPELIRPNHNNAVSIPSDQRKGSPVNKSDEADTREKPRDVLLKRPSKHEKIPVVCFWWARNRCTKGKRCRFLHHR